MCLNTSKDITASVKKKLFRNTNKRVFYKVLLFQYHKLVGPIYKNFVYKPGYLKSTKISNNEFSVTDGIHVCNTEKSAKIRCSNWNNDYKTDGFHIVVKVSAFSKDLIGANIDESAFSKVFLSKTEYERALAKCLQLCDAAF